MMSIELDYYCINIFDYDNLIWMGCWRENFIVDDIDIFVALNSLDFNWNGAKEENTWLYIIKNTKEPS